MSTKMIRQDNELDIAISILYAFYFEDAGKGVTTNEIHAYFIKRNLIVDAGLFKAVFEKMRQQGVFKKFGAISGETGLEMKELERWSLIFKGGGVS